MIIIKKEKRRGHKIGKKDWTEYVIKMNCIHVWKLKDLFSGENKIIYRCTHTHTGMRTNTHIQEHTHIYRNTHTQARAHTHTLMDTALKWLLTIP